MSHGTAHVSRHSNAATCMTVMTANISSLGHALNKHGCTRAGYWTALHVCVLKVNVELMGISLHKSEQPILLFSRSPMYRTATQARVHLPKWLEGVANYNSDNPTH